MNVTANQCRRYKVPLRGTRNGSIRHTKWGLSASSPDSRDIYVMVPRCYSLAPIPAQAAQIRLHILR